jgi:Fe-S oxidoreductase
MATYKAEFLSHYYEKKRRPRTAFTMGRIHRWARLASLMPGAANFFSHAPLFANVARMIADVHPNRTIPKFAAQSFKNWLRHNADRNSKIQDPRSKVVLWPDTFNNYFHPQVAQAAVTVLEAAGCRVLVPKRDLCCGRPLYDWGMIDEAKQNLRDILDALKNEIENGTPVVVLEPSCASVFKEELVNLFPNDENAKRLAEQTFLLGQFLQKKTPGFELPKLNKKALVHGHCHHKSIFKMDDDEEVLKRMGVDYTMPETGCCGMAGAFGFEKEHYDISLQCGERVLLPAVREAENDRLIITDGFSCHEQIAQTTERRALHLAQVIEMALHQDSEDGECIEKAYLAEREQQTSVNNLFLLGAGATLAGAAFWALHKIRE